MASNEFRTGFTTGTCASAASAAAAQVLEGWPTPDSVDITLPKGQSINIRVESATTHGPEMATAVVQKVAGDDPDVTNGALITARLTRRNDGEIRFHAGPGVGTITLPGLQLPPGEPAINPVPRQMITQAIRAYTKEGVDVEISVAGGNELAQRTFNPRLGIVGGISIIGTTGIVRPYCRKAFLTALDCAIDVAASNGTELILVPGNIGAKAVRNACDIKDSQLVEVGNEWEAAVQHSKIKSFSGLMVAGHPGKLAKFLNDQWQTHSAQSDSATTVVQSVARRLQLDVADTPTVEGIFTSLGSADQQCLGNALAEGISRKVAAKAKLAFLPTCLLVNMAGTTIGRFGEETP